MVDAWQRQRCHAPRPAYNPPTSKPLPIGANPWSDTGPYIGNLATFGSAEHSVLAHLAKGTADVGASG